MNYDDLILALETRLTELATELAGQTINSKSWIETLSEINETQEDLDSLSNTMTALWSTYVTLADVDADDE